MFKRYYKGILIPIILIIGFIFCGMVDGGAEAGAYPVKENVTIEIHIITEDGHEYVPEVHSQSVTFNTYGSANKADWELIYNF